MNKKLLATAVAGAIAPMAAQGLDVSVSGQVNRAIRFADNGVASDIQHVDGSASGSRWSLTAEGELMAGLSAGAHIEQEHASNRAWQVSTDRADAPTSQGFRHSYIYFSGDFGKLTMGHTSPAGNGAMWKSHNGAWMGTEYSLDSNSTIAVMTENGDQAGSAAAFMPSVNIGRRNILRYDTPSIGPVSFAASVFKPDSNGSEGSLDHNDADESHHWSFGANLSHDIGAANLIAGLLLMEDVIGISGGLAFANGTSINAAWASDDDTGADFEDWYINVAHSWGNMSVAVDYRTTDNASNKQGRGIGLGGQYALGSGVDVYAGFHNYAFDAPGPDLEDINSFIVGSRVRFN